MSSFFMRKITQKCVYYMQELRRFYARVRKIKVFFDEKFFKKIIKMY